MYCTAYTVTQIKVKRLKKVNLDGKRMVSNHPYFDGSRDTMLRGLPPANKLFGNKVLMGKIHIVLGGAGCTSVCRGARTATSFFGIFNDTRSEQHWRCYE